MNSRMTRGLSFGLLLFACAMPVRAQPEKPPEKPPENPIDKSAYRSPDDMSDGEKIGNSAENMATRPLRDLNLMKDKIPPELQEIVKAPYALKGIRKCSQYKAAVDDLTRILGPDVDSGIKRKGQNAGEFALGAAESVVGSLIPGVGLIRKISGADSAQKKARAAVLAGSLRRAYLKGTARAKGCKV